MLYKTPAESDINALIQDNLYLRYHCFQNGDPGTIIHE